MPYVKRTSRFDNKNVFHLLAFWQGSVVLEAGCRERGIREDARGAQLPALLALQVF